MRVSCPHCKRVFAVREERLPSSKDAPVVCPACKGRFSISIASKASGATAAQVVRGSETLGSPMEAALCCLTDPVLADRLRGALTPAGYHLILAVSSEDGEKRLRFERIALVVYQEGFDSDPRTGVCGFLSSISGEERRVIFIVWIGKNARSGDSLLALSKSADLIVAEADLDDLTRLLAQAQEARERFYRPFLEASRELGLESAF